MTEKELLIVPGEETPTAVDIRSILLTQALHKCEEDEKEKDRLKTEQVVLDYCKLFTPEGLAAKMRRAHDKGWRRFVLVKREYETSTGDYWFNLFNTPIASYVSEKNLAALSLRHPRTTLFQRLLAILPPEYKYQIDKEPSRFIISIYPSDQTERSMCGYNCLRCLLCPCCIRCCLPNYYPDLFWG
jgi:hypothetical protein